MKLRLLSLNRSFGKKTQHGLQPRRAILRLDHLEDRCLLSGDVVLRWNELALEAVKLDHALGGPQLNAGPTRTARALAIVHAAIYDAVNSVDRTHVPYLIEVPAGPGVSLDAAAAQAAHDSLLALYPPFQSIFDQQLAADFSTIASADAVAGSAVGRAVAAHILAARSNDGSIGDPPYTFGQGPGFWQVDPLHPNQQPLSPGWGSVTPFALTSAAQFRAPPTPALDSAEYTAAFNEVKNHGGDGVTVPTTRTALQTEIGIFWGYDGQPGLGTPPRLYNQIAAAVAVQQHNSVVENARLFALVNLAMADAGIAVWETKYVYNYWRPVTAIREAATDNNPDTIGDPAWIPLGAPADNNNGTNFTPPFPAYTSGHAGFGAALFRTLANFYGTDRIAFTVGSDEFNGVTTDQFGQVRPVRQRHFASFSQAAEENGQSRIYLGIHWSFDKTEGIRQGNLVADHVFGNFLRSRFTPHQLYVLQLYRDLLQREADPQGFTVFVTALDAGLPSSLVVQVMTSSPEYRTLQVRRAYQETLHREADSLGLANGVAFLAQGGTRQQLMANLLGSAEYFQSRSGGTFAGFVSAIYQDVFHRTADASGIATVQQALAAGVSRQVIASVILKSDECIEGQMNVHYQSLLHRGPDAGGLQSFTTALKTGATEEQVIAVMMLSPEYRSHLT